MRLDLENGSPDIGKTQNGLVYDADAALLIGTYSNELAAYRARKVWAEVLTSYFLLDNERDYEIWVTPVEDDTDYFLLSCVFNSACGRYAFWRVINEQSPEAEQKLSLDHEHNKRLSKSWFSSRNKSCQKVASSSEETVPWVMNSSEEEDVDAQAKSFIEYLVGFLKY